MTFEDLDLSNQLQYAIDDLGFDTPTPIQEQAFSSFYSGSQKTIEDAKHVIEASHNVGHGSSHEETARIIFILI